MSGHANLNLGQIITTPQHKDATHVAIAPVVAGGTLKPGAHVMIRTDGVAIIAPLDDCIGIIDPFLRAPVQEGERCWLFVYPNTVTSLRHDWQHPMFPDAHAWAKFTGESEKRLREIADEVGLTFERLIDDAKEWLSHGRLVESPAFNGTDIPDDFWRHFETFTASRVPAASQRMFLTGDECSQC